MVMKVLTKEMEIELKQLFSDYQPDQLHFIKKSEIDSFSQYDIVAYLFSWPDTIGSSCDVDIITRQGVVSRVNYHYGDVTYGDLIRLLPSLADDIDDIRPWKDSDENVEGWHWYELRSRCWLRIHDSIWGAFSRYANRYGNHVETYWTSIVRKCIFETAKYSPQPEQSKTFTEIVNELVSNGAHRYDNLKIMDVKLTEEEKYTRVTILIASTIPGDVTKDRGITWEIGPTHRIFSSTYAIAAMFQESMETSWLSSTVIEDPELLIHIMIGGMIDIVQQTIKAGVPFKNPFASSGSSKEISFDRDTVVNHLVGFRYGTAGRYYADALAVKMIGF